eukprot:Skav231902  [mRNA]  locus=scaffold960:216356:218469:- [translate_table: standard]
MTSRDEAEVPCLRDHQHGDDLHRLQPWCECLGVPVQQLVTNYRFRKSMGWEIGGFGNLYQAYAALPVSPCAQVPTVVRDIIYGWARGFVNPLAVLVFKPQSFTQEALRGAGAWEGAELSCLGCPGVATGIP